MILPDLNFYTALLLMRMLTLAIPVCGGPITSNPTLVNSIPEESDKHILQKRTTPIHSTPESVKIARKTLRDLKRQPSTGRSIMRIHRANRAHETVPLPHGYTNPRNNEHLRRANSAAVAAHVAHSGRDHIGRFQAQGRYHMNMGQFHEEKANRMSDKTSQQYHEHKAKQYSHEAQSLASYAISQHLRLQRGERARAEVEDMKENYRFAKDAWKESQEHSAYLDY